MRILQRLANMSTRSIRFADQFLNESCPKRSRDCLQAYAESDVNITEKVITASYCASRERVRSNSAEMAYIWILLAMKSDRFSIKLLRHPTQLSTLRALRHSCKFVWSRLWLRIVLAVLGDPESINALSGDIDNADFFQQQAILVRLAELQTRRANKTLAQIAKKARRRSVRGAAGLLLVLKQCKAGLEALRAEAGSKVGIGSAQIDANFGLAWVGEQSAIEWIERRLSSPLFEEGLIQLWRNCQAYGRLSKVSGEFFRKLQINIEVLVERKKLGLIASELRV